jgi:hypothetical protein
MCTEKVVFVLPRESNMDTGRAVFVVPRESNLGRAGQASFVFPRESDLGKVHDRPSLYKIVNRYSLSSFVTRYRYLLATIRFLNVRIMTVVVFLVVRCRFPIAGCRLSSVAGSC